MTADQITDLLRRLRTESGWYVGDETARRVLTAEFARLEGERGQVETKLNDALVALEALRNKLP